MVSRTSGCDTSRLKLLLDDRLPQDGQAEVAAHIETCEDCRRYLETMAAGADWWSDARDYLPVETGGELAPATPCTADFDPRSEPATLGGDGDGPRFDFLAPSDNLEMIGPA
jgi:serine/threonine-protein kinase